MVPHCLKAAVFIAVNKCVLACLVGVFPSLKLFFCHINRIKSCAGRFFLATRDEDAAVVELIPRTVVYFRVFARVRVFYFVEKLVFIAAEVLSPEYVVHNLACLEEIIEHFHLIVGEVTDVSGQSYLRILVCESFVVLLAIFFAARFFFLLFAAAYKCCRDSQCHC